MKEINREHKRFRVRVREGVEEVHLGAHIWLALINYFNAFNMVKRVAVLAKAATCLPALTLL